MTDRLEELDVTPSPAGPKVVRLSDVEPERIEWLWPGYLPSGKVVVLDGDPGVGKSTVSLDIAARLTTGSPMPDGSQGAKGNVLVLSAEDGLADTIRPRLDSAGADTSRIITVPEAGQDEQARPVSIPGDLPLIEQVITANEVRLFIVDVLMAYLAGEVNAHRDQDVRRALHVLAALAQRTRCCVLVLRHLNKSASANALYRGGGSIGIIGAARAGFMCGRDPDDETGERRVFASIKMNIAAEPPSLAYRLAYDELHDVARVRWEGVIDHRAVDLLGERESDDDRDQHTARDEAAEWLTGYLTDNGGEATPGDAKTAARAAGIATRTLERARIRAGARLARSGFPARTVWQLGSAVSPQTRQARQHPGDDETGETGGETGAPEPSASPGSPEPHGLTINQQLLTDPGDEYPVSDWHHWPEGPAGAEENRQCPHGPLIRPESERGITTSAVAYCRCCGHPWNQYVRPGDFCKTCSTEEEANER